jgi:hypothetical protein
MKAIEIHQPTAQDIQDRIFRRMPIEKKLKKLDSFYNFAKELSALGKNHGRNRTLKKSRQSFRET